MTKILSQYKDIKREIEHIEYELMRLENKMYTPRTSTLSDMPKGPIAEFDQIGNNLIKLEELRNKYNNTLEQLCDQQLIIEMLIDELEPLERDLIRYRYIDGLKWRHVFEKIGYSQKQTFRIHSNILKKLSKMEKMTHTDT